MPVNEGEFPLSKVITLDVPAEMSAESAKMLDAFFEATLEKFVAAQRKHNWEDDWKDAEMRILQNEALHHLVKGDPRDVAIYCAICHHHNWPTYGDPK